jgi:hypothetical protein
MRHIAVVRQIVQWLWKYGYIRERLSVIDDGFGNQCPIYSAKKESLYVVFLPFDGSLAVVDAIKDELELIGQGLTECLKIEQGRGRWRDGADRIVESVLRVEVFGPATPEAREQFNRVMAFAVRELNQKIVKWFILPAEVTDVANS